MVRAISLTFAGEIVGIAGLMQWSEELIQADYRISAVKSGSIKIKGQEAVGLPVITEMIVSHVPEDRHRDGLVLE